MRGGWRRRRVVGVVVAFILVAMLVAGLVARAFWTSKNALETASTTILNCT